MCAPSHEQVCSVDVFDGVVDTFGGGVDSAVSAGCVQLRSGSISSFFMVRSPFVEYPPTKRGAYFYTPLPPDRHLAL